MSKIVSPYWQYRNVPTNKLITLDQVFERQVKLFPNKTVLKIAGQTITYEDLDKLANRLANMLQDMHHIEHGDIVAIHMKRSIQMIICIIAILKAGAAFVILNSDFSLERMKYILKDSQVRVLIHDSNQTEILFNVACIKYGKGVVLYKHKNPVMRHNVEDLAYVMYTTGTSGFP